MAQIPTAEQTAFPGPPVTPQASPADFGAQVGGAQRELGQSFADVGDIEAKQVLALQGLKNEATAQDADVSFQSDLGKMESDFYGLKGKAQADAYPAFINNVSALRRQYLGNMPNPMAQEMLGQSLSYSVGYAIRRASMSAGAATKDWMIQSAAGRSDMLVYQAQQHFTDPNYIATAKNGVKASIQNYGELQGWSQDTIDLKVAEQNDKIDKGAIENGTAYLNGLSVQDRAAALAGTGGRPQGTLGGSEYHVTTAMIESGGNAAIGTNATGHTGLFQASADWWKRYGGGGDINNADDQHKALDRETADNLPKLQAALGRPVTNADLYLAHQQGERGAENLLKNPDLPAIDSVGYANVAANTPVDPQTKQPIWNPANVTAGEFAQTFAKPFSGQISAGGETPDPTAQAAVALLPPDKLQAMIKSTLGEWHTQSAAAYADQEHQRIQAEQQIKLQIAAQVFTINQQQIAHHYDPSKPDISMLQITRNPLFVNNPIEGNEAIKSIMATQKELDKPPSEAGVSARNASVMFGKLFPSDGSPPLTQKDIDAALVNQDPAQHINISEHTWLTKQLAEAKDPASQRINSQLNDVFKVVERQIDPSFSGSGGESTHSPFSGTRMLQYKQAVAEKIAAFKAAGKDPAILFDPTPTNKDYVGSAGFTAPYTRSLSDLMTEEATGQQTQPVALPATVPAAAPAPSSGVVPAANAGETGAPPKIYKTMADLQGAINAHEMTLADAQKYALDHKIARVAAKPASPGPQVPTGQ